MPFLETLRISLRALAANKLRAVLTMLGIIIGVAAVVALLSVGRGVEQFVNGQFQGIGSNLLFVVPGNSNQQSPSNGLDMTRPKPLTSSDAEFLATRLDDVLGISTELTDFGSAEYGREFMTLQISGASRNYLQVRSVTLTDGEFFSENDERSAARVAVVGPTVVTTLFPNGEYPIGQNIKVNQVPFRIIGVLASRGGGLFGDQDRVVLVPITTAQQRLYNARTADGKFRVSAIYVQARDDKQMEALANNINDLLRDYRRIEFIGEEDYTVLTQAEVSSAFGQVASALTTFLGAIAGISLLVGGIGIMNIMLVSVTERTKEIGLRKALGAKQADVLWQFLTEAVTLSLLGGILGIIIGGVFAQIVHYIQPTLPVGLTLDSILLATGVSASIGLFFGLYPAARAARLSPMVALRYE